DLCHGVPQRLLERGLVGGFAGVAGAVRFDQHVGTRQAADMARQDAVAAGGRSFLPWSLFAGGWQPTMASRYTPPNHPQAREVRCRSSDGFFSASSPGSSPARLSAGAAPAFFSTLSSASSAPLSAV